MQAAALNSFATHILSDRHSIILTAVALSASAWHTPINTQTHTNCLLWMKDVDVENIVEIKWNCSHVDVLFCKYLSVCKCACVGLVGYNLGTILLKFLLGTSSITKMIHI